MEFRGVCVDLNAAYSSLLKIKSSCLNGGSEGVDTVLGGEGM